MIHILPAEQGGKEEGIDKFAVLLREGEGDGDGDKGLCVFILWIGAIRLSVYA
jgi:hypothetical protein